MPRSEPRFHLAPTADRVEFGLCCEFWVPGRLPSLNDLLDWAKLGRNRGAMYSEQKRMHEARIQAAIYEAELPAFGRVALAYELVEPDWDRDPDNVLAGAQKFILDALVRARVLRCDTMRTIVRLDRVTWRVDPADGVRVTIRSVDNADTGT